jgi:hypothetical protein
LARKHSSISLKRFREIESVFKRGAFALVDANDALGKSKRDASISALLSLDLHTKGASNN